MTITSTGRVGIGTTNPVSKLELQDGTFTVDNGNIDVFFGGISISRNSANNTALKVNQRGTAGIFALQDDGTDVLTVIDGGNVGIGTSSPDYPLHVAGNSLVTGTQFIGDTFTRIQQGSGNLILTNSFPTGGVVIRTNGVENMRVDADGKVGIGTTTPSALLEIASNSTNDFIKLTTTGGGATPVKLIFEKTALEQGVIEFNRNGDFEIYNTDNDGGVLISGSGSATADMYINHSGNVGIGTTAPNHLFSVNNKFMVTSTGSAFIPAGQGIGIDPYSGGTATNIYFNTGNVQVAGVTDFTHNNASFIVKNSGNVGIGTTAPALQSGGTGLHINAPTSSEIKFTNSTTGTTASDGTALVSNGTGFTINNREAGSLTLGTNNSTRLYIDSAGKVGIGTTVPSEKLHVSGNIHLG